jgi:hypothetical protein
VRKILIQCACKSDTPLAKVASHANAIFLATVIFDCDARQKSQKQKNMAHYCRCECPKSMTRTNGYVRQPLLKLPQPIVQGAARHDDEVRTATTVVEQVRDKRYALNGLAKSHFV